MPTSPLNSPINFCQNRPDISLRHRISSSLHRRQIEQSLLNFRRQVQERHDLRHSSAGDVTQPGQFGVTGDLAGLDQSLESDRQGHQFRHARQATPRGTGRHGWFAGGRLLPATPPPIELYIDLDRHRAFFHHAASPRLPAPGSARSPLGRKVIATLPSAPS